MNINKINAPTNFKSAASVVSNVAKKAPEAAAEVAKSSSIKEKALALGDKYVIENLAKGIGKLSSLKGTERMMDAIGKWKSPYQRLCDIGSIVLTIFTVKDTLKSKKISDERKPFMVVNNILVTAVSSTLAALIDNLSYTPQKMIAVGHAQKLRKDMTKKALNEFKNDAKNAEIISKAAEMFKDTPEKALENAYVFKNAEKFWTGLGKFKSTFIFTSIVRFLVPVAFVPITAKIIDKLEKRAKEKKGSESGAANNQPQAQVQAQAQTPQTNVVQNASQTANPILNNNTVLPPKK